MLRVYESYSSVHGMEHLSSSCFGQLGQKLPHLQLRPLC